MPQANKTAVPVTPAIGLSSRSVSTYGITTASSKKNANRGNQGNSGGNNGVVNIYCCCCVRGGGSASVAEYIDEVIVL